MQTTPVEPERRIQRVGRRLANLAWISLFHNADESAVIEAIADSEVLTLLPGDTLLRPGQFNDSVFLVLSGQLGAYLGDESSPDKVIPIAPGECLGELSAIDGKAASALVKVLETSRVLQLTHDIFWHRLMAVPGVARNILEVLAKRMRRNTEAMLEGQRRQIELEYLRQELDVARQLQIDMLPQQGRLFPERQELEVAGTMEAASSIGGDLFDAFFVDERRLFFCIGDVSGHGIPAAIFMARTISLIRIAVLNTTCPAVLLSRINEQLCNGNDANMFVTLFCGFLEVDTGRMVYSNAGHLAPLHYRAAVVERLTIPKGAIIGVLPEAKYLPCEAVLAEGDVVLCFTDGVTEAQTAAGEEFSEERLVSLVEACATEPLEFILSNIREGVASYSGDLRLADDCTMLAMRRRAMG